jgi:hypothetical protein
VLDACHSARHTYPIGGRPEHNHRDTTPPSTAKRKPPRTTAHRAHTPNRPRSTSGCCQGGPQVVAAVMGVAHGGRRHQQPPPRPRRRTLAGKKTSQGPALSSPPPAMTTKEVKAPMRARADPQPMAAEIRTRSPLVPRRGGGQRPQRMSRANRRGRSNATPTLGAQMPRTSGHSGGDNTQIPRSRSRVEEGVTKKEEARRAPWPGCSEHGLICH